MPQQQPQQQEQQSGKPPGLIFEQFQGVNTATTRPGVPDQMAYWLDGFMPLQPRNLRTLWGVGPSLYTAPSGTTIVFYFFFNIKATEYVAVFLSDGSVVQVNTVTGVQTSIMPAGSIGSPAITNIGCSQYGQQYLIIVANQINGYWVWDGATLFGAGGLAPVVTITNVGSGYVTPPLITATGGHGSGATFAATIANGIVTSVIVTNAGSGYLPTDTVTLVFTGGNTTGTGATFTANMALASGGVGAVITLGFSFFFSGNGFNTFQLTSVVINNAGSGYSALTAITIGGGLFNAGSTVSNGWRVGIPGLAITSLSNTGQITGVQVIPNPVNPQNLYTTESGVSAPVTITDVLHYKVSSVTVVTGGSNYAPSVTPVATGGNAFAQATFSATVLNGVIVAVTVLSGGSYGNATPPAVSVSGNALTPAAATVGLMAIGIQGTAVETYQGHIWVFNGPNYNFTAPGSVIDFSTAGGGGSDQSNSSLLRVGYTRALSALGYLFLIGDSSMDYISNVQTSASAVTSFSINNADPNTGSSYPASCMTLGMEVILANGNGIWSSSSGSPFKRNSEPLDGVYSSVPAMGFVANPFNGAQISAAIATIFDRRVYMMLVPIVDPVSGVQVNKLLMTQDGKKWWASQQDVPLIFIATQDVNSSFTTWGTDGQHLYPLFQRPSNAFSKVAQSRLWDAPAGYDFAKTIVNLFVIAQFYGSHNLNYSVTVDNETALANSYTGAAPTLTWTNASGQPMTWTNSLGNPLIWFLTGAINVLPPTAVAQVGVLNGMTLSTQCDDMALITAMLQPEVVQYRA